jgi:hypothetical protein
MENLHDNVVVNDGEEVFMGQGGLASTANGEPVAPQGNGPMHWTLVQSGFMLRRFHDLVAQGVKTNKGFKEVHVRQVAAMLSEFTGAAVSVSLIHNHMRK